ncbi:MAG: hypothetical protein JRH20_22255 [Deltaproteobacteria bacterium]|nr:hypothetical protein [Deltaproteobacteria bacterium]
MLCFVTSSLTGCVSGLLSENERSVPLLPSTADAGVLPGADGQASLPPSADSALSQPSSDGVVSPVSGDGPEAPSADAAPAPKPDLGPPALPASCVDGKAIDLSDPRVDRRSNVLILERHFADGSPTEHELIATFDDYSLYKGTPAAVETFGVNCVGIVGRAFVEGDKHCEYKTTSCTSDADCADGVSCRETDRLDASSVSFTGFAIDLEFEKQSIGRFSSTAPGAVFSPIDEYVYGSIGKGDAHSHYDYAFSWFYSGVLAPKKVKTRSPDLSGGTTVGDDDLVFQWSKNSYYPDYESDLIYIELRTGPKETARRLKCVAKDDGCKTIPAAAMKWLTGSLASGAQLEVLVSHHFPLAQSDWEKKDIDWRLISAVEVRGSLAVK